MRQRNIKHTNKPILAGIFLLLWMFAQANVVAHDLLIDHSISASCEWQCHNGANDDLIASSEQSPVYISFVDKFIQHSSVFSIESNQYLQPQLRAPPQ